MKYIHTGSSCHINTSLLTSVLEDGCSVIVIYSTKNTFAVAILDIWILSNGSFFLTFPPKFPHIFYHLKHLMLYKTPLGYPPASHLTNSCFRHICAFHKTLACITSPVIALCEENDATWVWQAQGWLVCA